MKTKKSKFILLISISIFIIVLSSCSSINQIGRKNGVGTMSSELIYGCEGGQIKVSQNGSVLSERDVGVYILHNDSLFNNNNILSISKSGEFDDPKIYCTKFYVSYLFGKDIGDGLPDFDSSHLKIISSTPVIWLQSVKIYSNFSCDFATGDVEMSFTINEGCYNTYTVSGDINIEEAKIDTVYSFKKNSKDGNIPITINIFDKGSCISSISEKVQCLRLGPPIRNFPFPPPKASASHVLDKSKFKNSKQLSDINSILSNALDSCGYSEKSYYPVPNGFALITRMEKISEEVIPLNNDERWHTASMLESWDFNLSSYFDVLLNSKKGKYRLFAFIVTDNPFSQNDTSLKIEEAENFLSYGLNVLPEEIAKMKVSDLHECTALIYEFNKTAFENGEFVERSNFLGKDHLTKNNFLNLLEETQK